MTRRQLIQQVLRQAYGGIPSDDSMITELLANQYLNQGIGFAAKQNYVDSIKLDGISYINNGFVTTFSDLTVTAVDVFTYSVTLPQIPVGIGQNEGIPSLRLQGPTLQGSTGKSIDGIPLNINQVSINNGRRRIPNRFEYWYEGGTIYIAANGELLETYTAIARLVSGGDSTDLDSVLNVPDDYIPIIVNYMKQEIAFELSRIQDTSNDGADNPR